MEASRQLTPAERLQIAFELHDAGVALMRQNLKRRHPDADEAAIEQLLVEWLQRRPAADHGSGIEVPRPRADQEK